MKNYFEIENAEQLKAIADPLRRRLLEIFAEEPTTTKQAATMIGEKPTKLYHHVDFLEQNGLIELVKTQPNRGTTEKYYQSVARKFVVCKELIEVASTQAGETNTIENMLAETLEDSLKKLRESLDENPAKQTKSPRAVAILNNQLYLNDKQINELAGVIQNWLKQNDVSKSKDKSLHQLTMAIFPITKK
jgi:predicted ArsR family transcriptional regulator